MSNRPLTSTASRLFPSIRLSRGFHKSGLQNSLQLNCAMERPSVMRPMIGALPDLSRLLFLRWSNTFIFMSSIRFENCGQNYPVQSARYLCRFVYINAKTPCAKGPQLPITASSLPITRQGNGLVTELLLGSALFCLLHSMQSDADLLLFT